MKKYLFLIIAFLNISLLFGQTNKELFYKANDFYQKRDYENAAKNYESITKQGYESAEVYYNLGNCYYKTNNIPLAILNYERAIKLAPGDEDIDMNLKIANLKIIDKIEPLPPLFFKNWWTGL